jgi:hypothetical protein
MTVSKHIAKSVAISKTKRCIIDPTKCFTGLSRGSFLNVAVIVLKFLTKGDNGESGHDIAIFTEIQSSIIPDTRRSPGNSATFFSMKM